MDNHDLNKFFEYCEIINICQTPTFMSIHEYQCSLKYETRQQFVSQGLLSTNFDIIF